MSCGKKRIRISCSHEPKTYNAVRPCIYESLVSLFLVRAMFETCRPKVGRRAPIDRRAGSAVRGHHYHGRRYICCSCCGEFPRI
jgi:hypothetical protein